MATKPWTRIEIDGAPMGSTPLFRVPLPPGTHKLRLFNEAKGIELTQDVEIERGKTLKLNLILGWDAPAGRLVLVDDRGGPAGEEDCLEDRGAPAYLTVRTEPWSKVYVDGAHVGSTPLFRHRVKPGDHVLRLVNESEKRGNLFTRFHVKRGETVKVDLSHR